MAHADRKRVGRGGKARAEFIGAAVRAQTDKEFIEQDWLRKTADFAEGVKAVAERRPGNFINA